MTDTYDRWADQKAKLKSDFDEYMLVEFGPEQDGVSPLLHAQLLDAWQWSAIRTLELASAIAVRTYEGGTSRGEDGDSGYDFMGENTGAALLELTAAIFAETTKGTP